MKKKQREHRGKEEKNSKKDGGKKRSDTYSVRERESEKYTERERRENSRKGGNSEKKWSE